MPSCLPHRRHILAIVATRNLFRPFASSITRRSLLGMAPKQATLGYVRSSQMTLGWVCLCVCVFVHSTHCPVSPSSLLNLNTDQLFSRVLELGELTRSFCRKFFSRSDGSKPPPRPQQQTKLSFATKPSAAADKAGSGDETEPRAKKAKEADEGKASVTEDADSGAGEFGER